MATRGKSFELQLSGTPQSVRRALAQVRGELERAGTPPDLSGRMEIVLAEVLNNVVEHAFRVDLAGKIRLHCVDFGSDWCVVIEDNGHPMPNSAVPNGQLPDLETALEDLPEGGFGWALVHMLARDVRYCHREGKNRLEFRLPKALPLE